MATVIVKRTLAVLKLPSIVPDLLFLAKAIHKSMFNNPRFSASAARVSALLVNINALDASQTGLSTTPPTTTVAARNIIVEQLKNDLRYLRNDVQLVADSSIAQAEGIILSAGMAVKKATTRGIQKFTAIDGKEAGQLIVYAEGKGPHQWQQSPDMGQSIVHLDPTTMAQIELNNLPQGVKLWIRYRKLLPQNNYGPWSNWLPIVAKVW